MKFKDIDFTKLLFTIIMASICGLIDVLAVFGIIYLAGCTTETTVSVQNQQANNELARLQRIQTLQFELMQHPEYKTAMPETITVKYTADEIAQAKRNLKW